MIWSLGALCLGFGIDLLLGDPHGLPHPVVFIGKLIDALETLLRRLFPKSAAGEQLAGGVLWVLVTAVSTALPAAILWLCHEISPCCAWRWRVLCAGRSSPPSRCAARV